MVEQYTRFIQMFSARSGSGKESASPLQGRDVSVREANERLLPEDETLNFQNCPFALQRRLVGKGIVLGHSIDNLDWGHSQPRSRRFRSWHAPRLLRPVDWGS